MTPECRWDNDSFVMLCPVHASCKLLCELPGPQFSQKRKPACSLVGNNGFQKEVSKDDNIVCSQWKSHMESKNLVLCCSGVKACLTSMEVVNEQTYEVNVDTHGVHNGPSLGRLRVLTMKPKLFGGLKFYFMGDFEASYKRFLQDLVIASGGTVLHRKPLSGDRETNSSGQSASTTYIIYNLDLPQNCKPSKICSIVDRRRLDSFFNQS